LGIITVLIFGDYYVAFWGLLLSSISGIIQATRWSGAKKAYIETRTPLQSRYTLEVWTTSYPLSW
jgi:hypothetical protein